MAKWVASQEQAVLAAAAASTVNAMQVAGAEETDPHTEEKKAEIRSKLAKLDGKIASLAGLEEDAELKALLQRRESDSTQLKEQLRSMKPLRIRAPLAAVAKEKTERRGTRTGTAVA